MRRLIACPEAEAAFDRRLDPQTAAPLTIALSGGGDSLALLHMAAGWARRHRRPLLALTVDHQLHSDSAAWTASAGAAAKAAGADWRALVWTGPKPDTGVPAAARAARHRLLAEAARDAGAAVILFAHTADDVAEGEAMRRADAPTLGYLREWSLSPIWPEGRGVFLLRPLLGVRRAALRDGLRQEGLTWLDDPANDDLKYARARARTSIAASVVAKPAPVRDERDLKTLARVVEATPDGRLIMDRSALLSGDDATLSRFLSIATVCASGQEAPPRGRALDRLVIRVRLEPAFVSTLAGARVAAATETLTFMREPGEIGRLRSPPLALRKGRTAVWDRRFELTAMTDLTVGPLAGSAARLSKADRAALADLDAAIRPSLPALFIGYEVCLPQPFGAGPAFARALAGPRFTAASGLIAHERDISHIGIAQAVRSSYVGALALA